MLNNIGKYQIKSELGRGGMGVVYEGFDTLIERHVAIKTLYKNAVDKSEVEYIFGRFRQEARAAGRLSHPNILSIFDYGEEDDLAFIVLEWVDGQTLQEYMMSKNGLPLQEIIRVVLKVLGALCYAHDKGVVHRDIKPQNLLITKSGDIKVADFGLAKLDSSVMTRLGRVQGSPAYMSPEQYLAKDVDNRSDLYSVAVVLYELLTGTRPFKGNNLVEMMTQVMRHRPAAPSEISVLNIPKEVDEVVKKAMSRHPERRYKTAREFAIALKKAAFSPSAVGQMTQPHEKSNEGAVKSITNLNNISGEEKVQFDNQLQMINKEFEQYINGTGGFAKFDPASYTPPVAASAMQPKPAMFRNISELLVADPDQQVNLALENAFNFFNNFKHETDMLKPVFDREFKFDNVVTLSNMKWNTVKVDSRKQSAYENAKYSYVSVNLLLEMPSVMIKRPWYQVDALTEELRVCNLKTKENIELLSQYKNNPWLEVNLESSFQIKLLFKGNYSTGEIEIKSQNFEKLGNAGYTLKAAEITESMLENMAMKLLGLDDAGDVGTIAAEVAAPLYA